MRSTKNCKESDERGPAGAQGTPRAEHAAESPAAPGGGRPWWKGAVVYQIYPRSFVDTNGDGIGDLCGVTDRLTYVASLGVDAIWLSPFYTSPMKDFGYDIADHRDVDPVFGTLADFDRLLERAHAHGLKVLVDQVYSHTSDQHPWFAEGRASRDNPKADWYVWAEPKADGSPPNNWQSVFHGPAWTWDARRGQYYLHNFLPSQPDLNAHNCQVQDALLETARFWLDRGVDGFRLDAINFLMHDPALTDNPPVRNARTGARPFDRQHHFHNQSHPGIPAFLARLRRLIDGYDAEIFAVAEVGGEQANEEMKLYTYGRERLHSAYGFNFLYPDVLTPELVERTVGFWPGEEGEGWPSWAFSNHDARRVVSRWREGRDGDAFARLALLLLVTLRGNVLLYQGEELGLPQSELPFEELKDPEAIANWPKHLGRDGARTPMPWTRSARYAGFSTAEPWLPVDPAHRALAVDGQETRPDSILHLTRRLVALRKRHAALRMGDFRPIAAPRPLLAMERAATDERLLCVFNLGHAPVAWPLPEGWRVIEAVGGASGAALPPLSGFVAERIA